MCGYIGTADPTAGTAWKFLDNTDVVGIQCNRLLNKHYSIKLIRFIFLLALSLVYSVNSKNINLLFLQNTLIIAEDDCII